MSKEALLELNYLKRVMEQEGLEFFQDEFDVIRKALTKKPEWQPIETAPRDGRCFLIDAPDVESEVTMSFYDKGILVSIFDGKPYLPHVTKPKYWMPLPPPPKKEE